MIKKKSPEYRYEPIIDEQLVETLTPEELQMQNEMRLDGIDENDIQISLKLFRKLRRHDDKQEN